MDLETVQKEWKTDSKINIEQLDYESLKIPELHSKYYNMYLFFMTKKRVTKVEYASLSSDKKRYYLGTMDLKELKEKGWEPFPLKVVNANVQKYLDNDEDLVDISLSIGIMDDITDYLKSIIDIIIKRGFQIKNAIDFKRFTNGLS